MTVTGPDEECWGWSGSTLQSGRPRIGVPGKSITAARVICADEHHLDLGDRTWVARHTCDNLTCVNPVHITPGTYAENTADMWARGRGAYGDRRTNSVFNPDLVRSVRSRAAAGESHSAIARSLGFDQGHVSQVIRGKLWGWVE